VIGRKSLETGFLRKLLVTPGETVRNPVSIFTISNSQSKIDLNN